MRLFERLWSALFGLIAGDTGGEVVDCVDTEQSVLSKGLCGLSCMEILQVTVELRETDSSSVDNDTDDWVVVDGGRGALSMIGDDCRGYVGLPQLKLLEKKTLIPNKGRPCDVAELHVLWRQTAASIGCHHSLVLDGPLMISS